MPKKGTSLRIQGTRVRQSCRDKMSKECHVATLLAVTWHLLFIKTCSEY